MTLLQPTSRWRTVSSGVTSERLIDGDAYSHFWSRSSKKYEWAQIDLGSKLQVSPVGTTVLLHRLAPIRTAKFMPAIHSFA